MTGQSLDGRPLLECSGLSKAFGGLRAVDDVSIGFYPGVVSAIIGPNGAGKTTLFHLLTGVLSPTEGSIRHEGVSIEGMATWRVARRGIGRLFQDVRVIGKLSALENVMLGFGAQRGESLTACFLRSSTVRREERELAERATEILHEVGLAEHADAKAEQLSFGQQKMVALARLVAAEAGVLLLDEPASGTSPNTRDRLLALIRDLARRGHTIVVIEHNMKVVREIADTVHFMVEGRVVDSGSPAAVLDDDRVRSTYLGF